MADTTLAQKAKPEFVKVGTRTLATRGFRHDALLEHLKDHLAMKARNQWCGLDCLTRTFEGRDSVGGQKRMRRRMPRAFKTLLGQGFFLTIEYAARGGDHNGEAQAVKLFDIAHASDHERQQASEQLDRMARRRLITEATFMEAQRVLCVGATAAKS